MPGLGGGYVLEHSSGFTVEEGDLVGPPPYGPPSVLRAAALASVSALGGGCSRGLPHPVDTVAGLWGGAQKLHGDTVLMVLRWA